MKVLKESQGIAMVVVIAMMVILLSITGAALLFSGLNLKAASNLKTGGGAIHAADAGVQHALSVIPSGTTFSYSTNPNAPSSVVLATPFNGYTYTVTATNDSASTGGNSRAILISAATGPNNSKRTIKAYIGRSTTSWTPPGAVYIPGSTTSQTAFDPSSTAWTVTGNDTNYNNTAGPQPSIPGVATNNVAVTNSILTSLGTDARKQRVTGAGYVAGPPVTPSVQTTTRTDDVNTMAQNFINQVTALTCPPKCTTAGYNTSLGSCPAASPCTLGTDLAPQITYITGASTVSLGGYVNGSGVLVVNANELVLLDNFNFHGLVFHIQSTQISPQLEFTIKGNAQVYGGLLLGPNASELEIEVDNTAAINYSSQAINMVNTYWGLCCLSQPAPAKLIAWQEVMQ